MHEPEGIHSCDSTAFSITASKTGASLDSQNYIYTVHERACHKVIKLLDWVSIGNIQRCWWSHANMINKASRMVCSNEES